MLSKGQVQSIKVHPVLKTKPARKAKAKYLKNRCVFCKTDRLSFFVSIKSTFKEVLGILKITEYPNLIGQEHACSGMSIQG